jgi:hypothetical protein
LKGTNQIIGGMSIRANQQSVQLTDHSQRLQ